VSQKTSKKDYNRLFASLGSTGLFVNTAR